MEVEEAQSLILESVKLIQAKVTKDIFSSCGKVCAEDIFSQIDLPPYAKSAMDGYAVNSSDLKGACKENPVRLKVSGQNLAGDFNDIVWKKGNALRIMTGAYIPFGYDSVVKQEDTDYGEAEVMIFKEARPFLNFCKKGEDIKKGDIIVKKGERIAPVQAGLLAGCGIGKVNLIRPPKVAVISTGSELSDASSSPPLSQGKIYSTLSVILPLLVKRYDFDISYSGICSDDESELSEKILSAAEKSDIIITTGGISVGKKDITLSTVKKCGGKLIFQGVNIQPGTPTAFCMLKEKPVLLLSGNPYAALVNFDLYFPYIAKALTGCSQFLPRIHTGILQDDYPKVNSHRRFVRAWEEDGNIFLPSNNHASSVISNLTKCNCYIDIPKECSVKKGDRVKCLAFA